MAEMILSRMPSWKPGHDGEHDDEGADAQEDAAHADPDEEREVGALPARAEVAQAQEQLEGQAATHGPPGGPGSSVASSVAPAASGRRWGKRITSRIDGWLAKSMTSRSIPIPSPAVGGMPYSRART